MADAPKTAPPIGNRPRCPMCAKPLQPFNTTEWHRQNRPDGRFVTVKGETTWSGRYRCYGAFCTLRCCEAFANKAHQAGYRLVRK